MRDIITAGQGAVLGHVGVDAPTRSAPRGTSPSATTCTSRSMEQPQYNLFERDQASSRSTPGCTTDIGLGLTTWSPLASGPAHRQVPRRRPRRQPRGAARATSGSSDTLTDPDANRPGARARRDRRRARRQPRAAGDRLVRVEPARLDRDHRARAASSRCTRTSARSTCSAASRRTCCSGSTPSSEGVRDSRRRGRRSPCPSRRCRASYQARGSPEPAGPTR